MLYILTSIWVLWTPNAGQNSHFHHFLCLKAKKMQKVTNLDWNLAKIVFFLILHQNAGRVFLKTHIYKNLFDSVMII